MAFEKLGIKVDKYIAFEIDKYAKSITRHNYPDTIFKGDVLEADFTEFVGSDFVIGGSPCTYWSISKNNREVDKTGMGWQLFMKYIEALRSIKPKWFLYENVASMPKTIKDFITDEFQVEPIAINSALVSAQQRKRLYWTNIPGIQQPADKEILLKNIMEDKFFIPFYELSRGGALRTREDELGKFKRLEVRNDEKLNCLTSAQTDSIICKPIRVGTIGNGGQGERIYSVLGKSVCISSGGGGRGAKTCLYKIDLPGSDYAVRKLTPIEAERCQTLCDDYTAVGIDETGKEVKISDTQRYKTIGNGWTIDVIAHILSYAKL